ncbi:spore germination protein [Paenibacillus oryzisoli]|uniref:spore germination protein n=1 Tax=Paenibacillus oryzisoli TaxID=1850517 RepID=UPI003D2673FE
MNETDIRYWFELSEDVIVRSYPLTAEEPERRVLLIYCDGMVQLERIDSLVLPKLYSLMKGTNDALSEQMDVSSLIQLQRLTGRNLMERMGTLVYSGFVVLFFEESEEVFSLDIASPPNRQPEESSMETSIKGPRDGFTENVVTNIALVRKRLLSHSMCCEKIALGRRSNTVVALLYLGDVINPDLLQEVKDRLQSIDVDAVISSMQLMEPLSGNIHSFFPLIDETGRPDYVADCLLRGRFTLLVDGSPIALIGPVNLMFLLNSPEDVHNPFTFVAFERLLRLIGLFIAIFLPGFWIAVSSFNLDQIPFQLVATISSSRLGLPLSGAMDFIVMLLLFELFREAGARLPKVVGQTVTVVGGLIVGDAAIRSGVTSPTTLVVTSLSTIAMYTLVNQSLSGTITIMRVLILLASTMFGIYGFMLSVMGLVLFMSTLESFGVPYLTPITPPIRGEIIKSVIALPWKRMMRRPKDLHPQDDTRSDGNL